MLTIVWDVDDVLNDLMNQWFTFAWLPAHSECRVAYSGLTANPPHEALGIERSQYLASLDEFRGTERAQNMAPSAEILAWFHAHGRRFRHIALSARPLESAPDMARWVMEHFGAWIRCVGVVPTRTAPGVPTYDRNKADFLAWLGRGDILIDDSPENIRQAQSIGLTTLMPPQPWNDSPLTVPALLDDLSRMAGLAIDPRDNAAKGHS
jgi:hypothetical protein